MTMYSLDQCVIAIMVCLRVRARVLVCARACAYASACVYACVRAGSQTMFDTSGNVTLMN